jgi:hypothetical protein
MHGLAGPEQRPLGNIEHAFGERGQEHVEAVAPGISTDCSLSVVQ